MENKKTSGLIGLAIVSIIVIALALVGFMFLRKPADVLEGQAEATTVKVSGKLPGRVVEIFVAEGQKVQKGDTLVHIHSSLAEAKMMQAQGMETAAKSQDKKVDAGTRKQIIQSAYGVYQQAVAATQIAEKTYKRMEALFSQGVVSEQKRDEAKAAYEVALNGQSAAKSQYELAVQGAQKEDKTSAKAMVEVAKGGVAEVEALLEDQYLTAPCDGEIESIYPEESELIMTGAPIMSILRLDKKYVVFNVREELLKNFKIGEKIKIRIPAVDKETEAEVYYINDLGSYATWKATKATGEWDSKTFQIKARPVDSIPELRPGMTVLYQ